MQLILYTRQGCGLCDRLEDMIAPYLARHQHELVRRDIDTNESYRLLYGDRIPVLTGDGQVILEGRPDDAEVAAAMKRIG